MSEARMMLLESLAGHLALLRKRHPKKADSTTSARARRYVRARLRACSERPD